MADKRITDLPLILSGDISSLDVLPIVNVELDITNKVTADQLKAYINSGITDVFVTGGTYNTTTGDATFTNNTGGTFSISGFYTGSTDVFVTGGTYDNNLGELIFTNNTGGTFNINGLFTGNTDVFVTGGTYSNGTTTFTNNTGGTFNVVGYYTGETSYVNSLTTGTGLSGDTTTGNITLINTAPDQVVTITGGTNLSVVGSYPNFGVEFTGATSSFFTGGTVSGATNFTNGLSADTFSATTISGGTLYGDGSNLTGIPDYYLTGLTFDNGTYFLEAFVNDGNTYQANLSILGGDLRVTGGTYNPGTGIGTFTNNSGATFDVSGFLVGYTDHYVTGFTYDNINTFNIYDNSGSTFSASINNLSATTISATTISAATYQNLPIDPDTYVTGYTYSNNTFTIKQNQGQPDLTTTINSVTGLTVNGNLTVTGTSSLQGLSATTISATTIGSSGDCIDDIYVSSIHSCSPLNINPLSEGDVFFGSSVSGVTIDTTNNRFGLGTPTPQTALELVSNNTSSIGNVLRFRDSDTVVPSLTQQFIGKIEFFSNENSGGSTGVKSYVAGVQDANANSSIIFGATGGTGSLTAMTASTTSVFTGERMRIDSIGNVGIGIIPSAKLHINNTTTGNTILIEDTTNPDTTPFVIDASGNTSIGSSSYLTATGGERPTLQISNGSAGAVTLPIANTPLVIQSNSSTTASLFSPNAGASQITFGSPSDSYASIFRYTPTSKQLLLSTNNVGGSIDFNTSNGLFAMRVTSGQTVGIGTQTPTERLDVSGKTKTISLQVTSGATNGYFLRSDASGNATWQALPTTVFTGGTVSGATNFTNGLTANTISATTLTVNGVNITGDTFVSGGTYSSGTLTLNRTNTTPVNITGFYTGLTINNNTNDQLLTASGLANTVNGETNATFNGITLNLDKNSTSPNIIVGDAGATSDAYIRFESTTGSTPTYAIGADKSDSNTFKLNYSAAADASPSVGSTRISVNTSGVVSIPTNGTPVVNVGTTNQIQLSSTIISSQIKLFNGTPGTLQSSLTQYSNFAAIEANVGSTVSNEEFYINNDAVSGATVFRNNGTQSMAIYPTGTTFVLSGSGVNVSKNLSVDGLVSVGQVSGTGVALYRNATTGILTTTPSDFRVKQNIEQISNGLEIVKNLRGVYFNWKDTEDFQSGDQSKQIGFVAQEVEEHLPEAVVYSGNKDLKTVKYSEITAVLVEAMKEQQQQIDNLKSEIEELKGRL